MPSAQKLKKNSVVINSRSICDLLTSTFTVSLNIDERII